MYPSKLGGRYPRCSYILGASSQDKYLSGITYAMRMKVAAALSAGGADAEAAEAAAAEVQKEAEAEEAAAEVKDTKKKKGPLVGDMSQGAVKCHVASCWLLGRICY